MACWCISIPMIALICQQSGAYGRNNSLDNVITFSKSDSKLKLTRFEAAPVWEIVFQFKTTATNGVFIYSIGDSLDRNATLIKVELADGDTIRFRYSVCNGLSMLEYKANDTLNDNQWHKVHVERNHTQARLRVDNFDESYLYLTKDEITCTLNHTGFLVVGAAEEEKDGFVGCLRGLRVNGRLQDLSGLVERGDYNYGLSVGCIGKCDSSPCFNGGTCIEGYSGYKCDCTNTPFAGLMCGKEVGVNMRTSYQILFTFNETQGLPAVDFMNISVGFATLRKQGYLMQFRDAQNKDYVSLQINNNGGVKFVIDQEFERWEINTPNHGIDYTNGQQHEAKMWREGEGGRVLHLQVDTFPPAKVNFGPFFSKNIIDSPKYLFVGNNDTRSSYRGFQGCIYRMQIDNIYPLKIAFQDPPSPVVTMTPPGQIREDMCGFEEVTNKPEPIETKPTVGDHFLSTMVFLSTTLPYSNDKLPTQTMGFPGGVVAVMDLIITLAIIALIVIR